MEWDDLLKRMYTGNLNQNEVNAILYCITEQVESNRKELERLHKEYQSHCHLAYGGETSPPGQSPLTSD